MAEVYLAEDPSTQALYAVKLLGGVAHVELALRFRREAEAQAKADAHPNVLRIHAWQETPEGPCLVMEYADGGDLSARLETGPLQALEAAALVRDLARGIAHVHRAGILHRDIKPANVLFDGRGVPRLCDFGLARVQGAESLTATGSVMGTPAYMAPEQASSAAADARADVYGLGALLYHCLTGRAPFGGTSVFATLQQVIETSPVPPSRLADGIPRSLEAVCLRCIAKSPGDRFQSADALVEALEECLEDGEGRGVDRRWVGLMGVSALVLLGLAAWSVQDVGRVEVLDGPPVATPRGDVSESKAAEVERPNPFEQPLKFLPNMRDEFLQPELTELETRRLDVWRGLFTVTGTWGELGRKLDPAKKMNIQSLVLHANRDSELYRRWALACYFNAWEQGAHRGMQLVGEWLIGEWLIDSRSRENFERGFELIRYVAEYPTPNGNPQWWESAEVLATAYTPLEDNQAPWSAVSEPSAKLARAWLAVAGSRGLTRTNGKHANLSLEAKRLWASAGLPGAGMALDPRRRGAEQARAKVRSSRGRSPNRAAARARGGHAAGGAAGASRRRRVEEGRRVTRCRQ
jgi:hypothetical protein